MDEFTISLRDPSGNILLPDAARHSIQYLLNPVHRPAIEPPKDLREFEDRLKSLLEALYERIFGLVYYLNFDKRPTLDKDYSIENLVDIMCKIEKKYGNKTTHINQHLEYYKFLKMAIEKDVFFDSEYYLGFGRDCTGISVPQKRQIALQAAAQILWYLEKDKIPKITNMVQVLKNEYKSIRELLEIDKLSSPRTIENSISQVSPVDKHARRGNRSKKSLSKTDYNHLVMIPQIFLKNGKEINFPKLRFAICCLTRILMTFGWSKDQIKNSKFIKLYRDPLQFYLPMFVNNWIDEAAMDKGRIFDL